MPTTLVAVIDGGLYGVVGDLHAMMRFVPIAQTVEDRDGVFLGGRIDHHFLEATSQRGVFLDIFAVLVEGRGADALDFPTRQGRLEHVRGVDRAFGPTRTNERVQLVDEEDRFFITANFIHHRLDPLLELAAILGAGDHHRQVEHHDASIEEQLRYVAFDHPLGKSLDDGRLADSGLSQQHGIVLRASAEDLDRPLDLVVATDHRVELILSSQFGEVASKAVEGWGLRLAALAFFTSTALRPAATAFGLAAL